MFPRLGVNGRRDAFESLTAVGSIVVGKRDGVPLGPIELLSVTRDSASTLQAPGISLEAHIFTQKWERSLRTRKEEGEGEEDAAEGAGGMLVIMRASSWASTSGRTAL